MPLYDYVCVKCTKPQELSVSYEKRDEDKVCGAEGKGGITCPGLLIRRVPSGTSAHLKGGGWASQNYHKGRKS